CPLIRWSFGYVAIFLGRDLGIEIVSANAIYLITIWAIPVIIAITLQHCSSGNTMTSKRSFDTSIPQNESIFVSLPCSCGLAPTQLFAYGRHDWSSKLTRGFESEAPAGFRSRRG